MTTRLLVRGCEPDTHAADAVQVAGFGGRLAELAPQPGEVDVDGTVPSAVRLAPHVGQQLTLGDHLSRALGQGQQEIELLARQVEGLLVKADLTGEGVDRQTTHDQWSFNDCGATAAKNRAEPGFDLLDPERLDDIVVGAAVERL